MQKELFPLIEPDELMLLHQKEKFILVDASGGGRENYLKNHLDGALFVDLDTQLADIKPDASVGGRHPLPSPAQFSKTLSDLGISPASYVVIYDDKNGSNAASRFWWMLKAIGHKKVQVLDGGYQAALKCGFPVSNKTEVPSKVGEYKVENWKLPLADINTIDKASQDKSFIIIDVRDEERFNGEKEPIDLVAGHIPNAINIPFATNLNKEGFYLSANELKKKYEQALKNAEPEKIIVHCGSGVTACHTLLAIAAAGMKIPNLYVGSWSEWSRNDRPMEKKK